LVSLLSITIFVTFYTYCTFLLRLKEIGMADGLDLDSDFSYANWKNSRHGFSRLEPEASIFDMDALLIVPVVDLDSYSVAFRLKGQPAAVCRDCGGGLLIV
jgi:hypothetical protein